MPQVSVNIDLPRKPVRGYSLSWSDLGYKINPGKSNEKIILSGLSGIVYPGSVVAVLGPSGAGKSTFLDVLAGRKSGSETVGTVAVNGGKDISIKHVSRYCMQEDSLYGNLTVNNTLMYAAHFNLPNSTSHKVKSQMVKDLLEEFGLTDVQNTIIGTPLRKGCSGGQVRRVSVASQVIGLQKGFLFLDEPTSGLDSVAATAVVKCVATVAQRSNFSVIATIHQPNTDTFNLFSHLLLLGQGQTIYFGGREAAIDYFESIGYPIPVHANPSDTYLQLTNIDFTADRNEGKLKLAQLAAKFKNSNQYRLVTGEIQSSQNKYGYFEDVSKNSARNGIFYQILILMSRAMLNAARNPLAYWVRVAMYVALAILMGTTWFRMDLAQSTVQDRLAGLFFAVAFLSFMAVAGIPAFLEERLVFIRETSNGLYGIGSYVVSNLLISIPFILIITLSFSGIAYYLMGLQESTEKFCTFVAILFLSLMVAEAQTVFISVAIPIFVGALAITAFTNGLWMVVQGFFVQKKNIPNFWKYSFHQIDFQKYAYEMLITNEMKGLTFKCEPIQNLSGKCACIIPSTNFANPCEFRGEDVLEFYDYANISFIQWTLILVITFLVFKILTILVLKYQFYKRK